MSPDPIDIATVVLIAAYFLLRKLRSRRHFRRHQQQLRANQLWRIQPPAIETEPGDPHSDDRLTAELIYIPRQRTEEKR